MMRGEGVATFKLAEEQVLGNFHCPPHFLNRDIEPELVPRGWYLWIERKVKTRKKKKNYNEDGEVINDLNLHDILAMRAFGRPIKNKKIKEGNWPKGVLQLSNNIREQNVALKDHYKKKISPEIIPITNLWIKKPGEVKLAATVEREEDDAVLSWKEDQIFKIPSSTNLPKRGEYLQPPITELARPLPKMNILVLDQQQRGPTNKPAQLFDTYHRLYWDNEREEHHENPRRSSLEDKLDQIMN
uniref:Uncharacterized protein n=1 Tax=Romanomermis culicivorax TaxID=13658 RepID=A0A915KB63_ROMCU